MLSEQEKQIVQYGIKNGKTKEETTAALAAFRNKTPVRTVVPPVESEASTFGERLAPEIEQRRANVEGILGSDQNIVSKVLQSGGQVAGLGAEIVEEGIGTGLRAGYQALPEGAQEGLKAVGKGAGWLVNKVASIPDWNESSVGEQLKATAELLAMKYNEAKEQNPEAVGNLEAFGNMARLAFDASLAQGAAKTTVAGGKALAKGSVAATKATGKAIQTAGKAIADTTKGAASRVMGNPVLKGAMEVPIGMAKGLSRVPSNTAINLAQKKAVQQAINKLPTKFAQNAARDGVDVADIKTLLNLPKNNTAQFKQLAKVTKDFAEGTGKVNPIEIVGKPITNRIKQLEGIRVSVGQKLGKVAETLGKVAPDELQPAVFESMKKVPGLNGIKVNAKGVLDFKNTVLTTAETAADRKAIQRMFTEAIKSGTGKSKHLLRQELFEILGGKKRSLQALTDTQEKAFEGIRAGLSNILETKNPTYKALSNDYRKAITPLKDMRKLMKGVGAEDDILDMSAGLLARRLTSNATSNPQIRSILRAMDKATKVTGKAAVNTEALQDFYNILDKYYDIAAKTGFKGQIKSALSGSEGIMSRVVKGVEGLAGETPAVRQKAIENLLKEILK